MTETRSAVCIQYMGRSAQWTDKGWKDEAASRVDMYGAVGERVSMCVHTHSLGKILQPFTHTSHHSIHTHTYRNIHSTKNSHAAAGMKGARNVHSANMGREDIKLKHKRKHALICWDVPQEDSAHQSVVNQFKQQPKLEHMQWHNDRCPQTMMKNRRRWISRPQGRSSTSSSSVSSKFKWDA